MTKSKSKILLKEKIIQILAVVVVFLLTIVVVFFIYNYFAKPSNFKIKNEYYGFKIQTPRGWVALENTGYLEDNILQSLDKCKKDKIINTVGIFRFQSFKNSENMENLTGAMLEIIVNCVPDDNNFQYVKNQNIYISTKDKDREVEIKQNYVSVLNKIISSLTFVK
jgi:flagellar basal body-associated protein FliL